MELTTELRILKKGEGQMNENWLSIFCSTYGLSFFGKSVDAEEENIVYFEKDNNIPEWVIKIDADMQVIFISEKTADVHELFLDMVEYLLKNISNWDMLGINNIPPENSIYTIDKMNREFYTFEFFYSKKS